MHRIVPLYAYDNLRGDGFAVRFARLNVFSTDVTVPWVLCWLMEAAFYVAYYEAGIQKYAGMVAFWLAWFTILYVVR